MSAVLALIAHRFHTTGEREVDRLLTVPNLVTLIRLLCLPLYLYLLFVRDNRAAAAWLLGCLGATDWIDGYLARRLGQVSEFGKKFDPTVDRLVFMVAIVGMLVDGAGPAWFLIVVLARELIVGGAVAIATLFYGIERIDVTFPGKLATGLLIYAVPAFLIGDSEFPGHRALEISAWIIGIPGLVLSLVTAVDYFGQDPRRCRRGTVADMKVHLGFLASCERASASDHAARATERARERPDAAGVAGERSGVCVAGNAVNVPEQLKYSTDHEWISRDGEIVRVGITDYAQDALGDVVFVQVPSVGATVDAGESFGEVESTKSVSDVYAPVSGVVVQINDGLVDAPQALNDDPYGDGWICAIQMSDPRSTTPCWTPPPTGS